MKDATSIIVIMDKSGSMHHVKADAIGGYNSFLADQQAEPGEADLTLVLFDTTYTVHPTVPLVEAQSLTDETFRPGGNTALLDAVGRAVTETGKRLSDLPETERPDKVIVVIITDGQENSSTEHTRGQVKEMIQHQQEKYSWQFLFLGANQDAFDEAGKLGIPQGTAANFAAVPGGVSRAYTGSSIAVSQYRREGKIDSSWKKKLN